MLKKMLFLRFFQCGQEWPEGTKTKEETGMRIVQVLPVLSYGDAIGNDTLAIRDAIIRMGYDTDI